MKLINHWLTEELWKSGELTASDVGKLCDCYTTDGLIFNEDPQKVYRCCICGAPSFDRLQTKPPFLLTHIFKVDTLDRGERTWKVIEIKPHKP